MKTYEIWDHRYHGKDSDTPEVVFNTNKKNVAATALKYLRLVYGDERYTLAVV